MPLYKTIDFNATTQIFVWKITESFEELVQETQLNEKSWQRLNQMKSTLHQCGFLSIRKLLKTAGYSDFDLYYDASGKPNLKDKKHISITHSFQFSAIIISDQKAGIDIEMQREKIIRIADKFVNDQELQRLKKENTLEYIRKLTIKWGAKEAIFKIKNEAGISFKKHIQVNSFEMEDKKTIAILEKENTIQSFLIYFEEIADFTLVYAFER